MSAPLKEGFTTGTAAATAAKAAVMTMCGHVCPESVSVALPPFDGNLRRLTVPVVQGNNIGTASVIKDGGDDPDATHKMAISATAAQAAFEGYGPPILVRNDIFLYGGDGIGRATLPGLPVAVGEPAINPVPREQIARAVAEALQECGCTGPVYILISAPEGVERAKRTLNARLGIIGGISILGTQGTVRPYSHDAWQATIIQGLNVAAALHIPDILFSTGRRSERLLFALYPECPESAGVQAADFAAFALREAAQRPFRRLVWGCFPGKLLKLAQGLEYTHAREKEADISMLSQFCVTNDHYLPARERDVLLQDLRGIPTAVGALERIRLASPLLHDAVIMQLANKAYNVIEGWVHEAASPPLLQLHAFSMAGTLLHTCGDPLYISAFLS